VLVGALQNSRSVSEYHEDSFSNSPCFHLIEVEIVVFVAQRAPASDYPSDSIDCDAHLIPASPRREFKVGFVFFRSQHEVGAEFGAAFGNEAFDQARLTFGQEFLHFFEGEFFFAEFFGDLED
jgi:hypothetical protein